jgi:hypothetical protein
MPNTHVIRLEDAYANFSEVIEDYLQSMKPAVPFTSESTKDGSVFTIQFQSEDQYEEFKEKVLLKTPFLQSIFK